jgi:hypothetical protein
MISWRWRLQRSKAGGGSSGPLAVPVSSFYLQNAAYHKGLIS